MYILCVCFYAPNHYFKRYRAHRGFFFFFFFVSVMNAENERKQSFHFRCYLYTKFKIRYGKTFNNCPFYALFFTRCWYFGFFYKKKKPKQNFARLWLLSDCTIIFSRRPYKLTMKMPWEMCAKSPVPIILYRLHVALGNLVAFSNTFVQSRTCVTHYISS